MLLANLLDNRRSWSLFADGSYHRIDPERTEPRFNLHTYFMNNPSLSGRGAALDDGTVPRLTLSRGRR